MAEEKKLIVDEDWKSQVQAEKEAAKQPPGDAGASSGPAQQAQPDDPPMPPASLEMLLTTLVTEAMIALGQVPHPVTGQTVFYPRQAQYFIDMIDMLREKTKGNVTEQEEQMMVDVLHQLRMAFIALSTQAPAGAGPLGE